MSPLKNIYLVEDDPDDQLIFTDALKQIDEQIKCEIARNGKDALEQLQSLTELPDLVFLDLNMPLMNGFECLSRIKNSRKLQELPIVIFTTSRNPEDARATHQLGANVFLSKPSDFNELKDKLSRILAFDYRSGQQSRTFAQYCV